MGTAGRISGAEAFATTGRSGIFVVGAMAGVASGVAMLGAGGRWMEEVGAIPGSGVFATVGNSGDFAVGVTTDAASDVGLLGVGNTDAGAGTNGGDELIAGAGALD
jgi:hypothetical protein